MTLGPAPPHPPTPARSDRPRPDRAAAGVGCSASSSVEMLPYLVERGDVTGSVAGEQQGGNPRRRRAHQVLLRGVPHVEPLLRRARDPIEGQGEERGFVLVGPRL